MSLGLGDMVEVFQPDEGDGASWIRGRIEGLNVGNQGVHLVRGMVFRWVGETWQRYTGLPFCLAKEGPRSAATYELEFVDCQGLPINDPFRL